MTRRRTTGELAQQLEALRLAHAERTPASRDDPEYSGDLLWSVLSTAPDFIMLTAADGQVLFVNHSSSAEARQRVLRSMVYDLPATESSRTALVAALARVRATRLPVDLKGIAARLTCDIRLYDARVGAVLEDDELLGFTIVARDVTEDRRVERALRDSETKLRLAVEATGMGLWTWEAVNDLVVWDERMCEIFGIDLAEAPTNYEEYRTLIYAGDREAVIASVGRALETGVYQDVVHRVQVPNGDLRWVLIKGSVEMDEEGNATKLYGGVLDITERRAVDERVRESQKLEAVGQLAAGVAHNFNNMLTGVMSNLELAKRRGLIGGGGGHVDAALDAADRAAQVVRRLMAFTRDRSEEGYRFEPVNAVIERVLSICRSTFDRAIDLRVSLGPPEAGARMYPAQIEQLLLNLCINARDAVTREMLDPPKIAIVVDLLTPGDVPSRAPCADHVNGCIRIAVSDNGRGVEEANRARLFEPFFTTKGESGSGLGLATAYASAVDHGGWLTHDAAPEGGAVFSVYLPLELGVSPVAAAASAPRQLVTGTVLLVDDESLVRHAVAALLRDDGFVVIEASDGESAVETYIARREEIDVVVLDRSMPGMSGADVPDHLFRLDPHVHAIIMSGFAADPAGYPSAVAVLEKPVAPDRLTAILTECVASRRGAARESLRSS